MTSDHFRSERDDLHELALTKLAGHGAEDARTNRLARVVDENGRGVVEFDVRTIAAAALFDRTEDDGLADRTLLDGSIGSRFLDGGGDDVAEAGVTAGRRSTQHLDAGDLLGAGVVRNLKNCSHLDHG